MRPSTPESWPRQIEVCTGSNFKSGKMNMKKPYKGLALFLLAYLGAFFSNTVTAQEEKRSPTEQFLPTIENRVAVNAHFTQPPPASDHEWALLVEAGIRCIRIDMVWTRVEKEEGAYDWSFYDDLTQKLLKYKIRPLFILGYAHPLYGKAITVQRKGKKVPRITPPETPRDIAAFARWSAEAAERYQACNPIWEIWNEPDVSSFWAPEANVDAYIRMALATADAIRKKQPQAILTAPSMSGVPSWHYYPSFIPTVLSSPLGHKIDVVSIHPYRSREPETVLENMDLLNGYIRNALPERVGSLRYLFSEWGYSTGKGVRTEEMQAAYCVRMQLSGLMAGAVITVWYDWRDDGDDPNNREHRFGLIRRNGEPKPAYHACAKFISELKGYCYKKRIALKNDANYALLFVNGKGERKLVVWNSSDGSHDSLPEQFRAAGDGRDMLGQPVPLKVKNNQLQLELTHAPIYITLQ